MGDLGPEIPPFLPCGMITFTFPGDLSISLARSDRSDWRNNDRRPAGEKKN